MKRLWACVITVVALASTAGVALASGTTLTATSVSFTSAALNAKVQTGDKVHFEYGTSALNLKTSVQTATGTTYSRSISGLTAGKTYRFRIVTDDNAGAVKTFTTASAPKVSTKGVSKVTAATARLSGSVDPNGAATNYNFEWGATPALGSVTAALPVGAGSSAVSVAAGVAGLEPMTRYYYRVAAANGGGSAKGAVKSFTTPKSKISLNGFTVSVNPTRIRYGTGAAVTGKLTGSGAGGVIIALEAQPFPFNAAFAQVATAKTAPDGAYTLAVPPLLISTKFRILTTRTSPSVVTETGVLLSRSAVSVTLRRGVHRLVLKGTTQPAAANGVVRVQRRNQRGRWVSVGRGKLAPASPAASRYRVSVPKRKGAYRVMVSPRDGGAHASGVSRVRVVR